MKWVARSNLTDLVTTFFSVFNAKKNGIFAMNRTKTVRMYFLNYKPKQLSYIRTKLWLDKREYLIQKNKVLKEE